MFRRRFIQSIAGSLATAAGTEAGQHKTVVYHVKGFTCVTCAVGLETLLRRQKGIARVEASYSDGIVHIEFDPSLVTDNSLRGFISEMGFSVAKGPSGSK
jgi:copper chaperone CopZ